MRIRAAVAASALAFVSVLGSALAAHADLSYPSACTGSQNNYSLTSGDDVRNYSNAVCVEALGGNDDLDLSSSDDTAWGNGGQDTIDSHGGNDIVYGGDGPDLIYGDAGTDYLNGGFYDAPGDADVIYDGTNPNGAGDVIVGNGADTLKHCTGTGSNGNDDDLSGFSGTVLHGPGYC